MAISQIAALTAHISFLLWELLFVWPSVGRSSPQMAISHIAALTAHISFVLWELIFGTPGVGRSTPMSNGNYRFLLWEHIFGRPSVGKSYIPSNSNFTDSCSDISYFIPTLRTHIWQTKCWQIYPPKTPISQIPALTTHISFLLWELILGRPGVGRSNPPLNSNFTDSYSDSSYFIPTLRAHIWHTRCWQIYPTIKWQLYIPTLRAHIWKTKCWQIYPTIQWQWYIPTLRAHIWQTRCWQIYPPLNGNFTDCCSDSSYSFLLWELIFGWPSVGRYTPLLNADLTDCCSDSPYFIPTVRAHISLTKCWQIYPPMSNGNYRFLLWEHIFGRPCVGKSNIPSNSNFTDSCSDISYFIPTLRAHIWQNKCWQIYPLKPPFEQQFHRFLFWQLIFHSYSENSYFEDQVLADLSHHQMAMIHSYSESSYLADQMLADLPSHQMAISQIAALIAHISFRIWEFIFGRPAVGRSSPPSNGDYRFLLWELIFGWPSVGRSNPLLTGNFTDCCSDSSYFIPTLRTHIWHTRCWQI